MIDTIKIKILAKRCVISDRTFFQEVKSSGIDGATIGKVTQRTNHKFRKQLQAQGIYAPKFYYEYANFHRGIEYLVLELSIPKLLYGHSLAEVTEAQFPDVLEAIQQFLTRIGVTIQKNDIAQSIVTNVAYCRNIDMSSVATAGQTMNIIKLFNYQPLADFSYTVFEKRNGGLCIKYYNEHSSFTAYEKLPEIAHHAGTTQEKSFALQWSQNKRVAFNQQTLKEIVRFEYTLQEKTIVTQTMKKFYPHKSKDFTLEDVFKDSISAQLLRQQVDRILNHPLQNIVLLSQIDLPIFQPIIIKLAKNHYQRLRLKEAAEQIALHGLKGYRQEFLQIYKPRTWFKWQRTLYELSKNIEHTHLVQCTNQVILHYIIKKFGIVPKVASPKQLPLLN